MSFSEEDFYREYKKIRNQFRKYDSIDLIKKLINYANSGEKNLENIHYHPWLIILLIKWILLDDNFFDINRKSINSNQLNKINSSIFNLNMYTRLPSNYDNNYLFMRAIIYQQSIYQKNISLSNILRQHLLFNTLEDNSYLSKIFYQKNNISIKNFILLSFVLMAAYDYRKLRLRIIKRKWFSSLNIEKSVIDSYLKCISGDFIAIRDYLINSKDSHKKTSSKSIFEQTPLTAKPLLNTGENYYSFHKGILFHHLEYFIYDQLRSYNAEKFMKAFGRSFESYIGDILKDLPLEIFTENDLKKFGKDAKKVVDFIVSEKKTNIFIEAKGVAGTHGGMTSHLARIVEDQTSNTALKALKQANEVFSNILNDIILIPELMNKENTFLIVVTYKELYLSNGISFKENIAQNSISEMYNDNEKVIPLENIYFISIESFEYMCSFIENGYGCFSDILEYAKKADSKRDTRKFDFQQHLTAMGIDKRIPKKLKKHLDNQLDFIEAMIK